MSALYPLTFQPIFKERVWGARNLERLYGKKLPTSVPIGESWEISDRPGDVSVISNGPLAGKDLHWLVDNHRADLLGDAKLEAGRFPLLIKLLDAQEKLSLQVHPPTSKAAELRGDPKTEMWFIADAVPDAELYIGLKHGVTPADFEHRISDGSVAECFHRAKVRAGDSMFLPSGRVHAIGAGLVIFEIQQNSDTTYRVFDWNRVGLDGKPRELHVPQSLASIDFVDFEPALISASEIFHANFTIQQLVNHSLFSVEKYNVNRRDEIVMHGGKMHIIGVVSGEVRVGCEQKTNPVLRPGDFCLIPAVLPATELIAEAGTAFLSARAE
ncbi:MAG: mannose-6-phosphate isomerase [Verrucomicrobia bacterium]|jgi:mannose-6-phosphate isomerase|nr:MAG: mannose-6-phosphate isomerase [Verrucomicrobiota bacterium]